MLNKENFLEEAPNYYATRAARCFLKSGSTIDEKEDY
jgi:hypothetical protein